MDKTEDYQEIISWSFQEKDGMISPIPIKWDDSEHVLPNIAKSCNEDLYKDFYILIKNFYRNEESCIVLCASKDLANALIKLGGKFEKNYPPGTRIKLL